MRLSSASSKSGKGVVWKSGEEIVEVSTVILNGTWRFSFASQLFDESPHGLVLSYEGTTVPFDRLHIRAAPL
jgi:hypothetical protein